MHILCTICSDLVNQAENIYVTNCGHIFHYHCLSQWIGRSQSCPQCRNKITPKCMYRIYPTISNVGSDDDAATLQSRLDNAQLLLRQQAADCKEKNEIIQKNSNELQKSLQTLQETEKKLVSCNSTITALKSQLEYVKVQNKERQKLEEENITLKKKMQTLTDLEKVLNASNVEVEQLLMNNKTSETTAIYASALKRALTDSQCQKNDFRDQLHVTKQELAAEKTKNIDLQVKYKELQEQLFRHERRKRKVCEEFDASILQDSWNTIDKVRRQSDPSQDLDSPCAPNDSCTSFTSMVNRIKNTDSPYLNLKQSSAILSTLLRSTSSRDLNKPSEKLAITTTNKKSIAENQLTKIRNKDNSIFCKKEAPQFEMAENRGPVKDDLNVTYDGLGGHSRLDIFPIPNKTSSWESKRVAPKLTSRHRLKNPNPAGNRIMALFAQAQDK